MPDSLINKHGIVVALPADLIFGARIRAAAETAGANIVIARNPEDALSKAADPATRMIILDLDRKGLDITDVVKKLKATSSAPILAYVSHVREDAIRDAKQAGADRVIARGAFANQLPELLKLY